MLNVDHAGFDIMDQTTLLCLMDKFNGGPTGLDTIAAAISEEKGTLEDVIEPYLIQEGYLLRTPRGRIATLKAYEHFNRTPSATAHEATKHRETTP